MNASFSALPNFGGQPPTTQPYSVGAIPTMSSLSPHRNQNQLDDYKRELELQIEEKKQRQEEERKRRELED